MAIATYSPSTRLDPTTNKLRWVASRYVALPHSMLTSWAFRDLSGGSAKLLLAVAAGYAGNNNGQLVATYARMKPFGFNSKESIARGLTQLIECGFIVRTCQQHLKSAALYAVTWLPINPPAQGKRYDDGIMAGTEALDLWRHVDAHGLADAA